MPVATNGGVHIHYEVEGNGPPLVLHIGYMGRGNDWRRKDVGVVHALRDEYQLIVLDPRGFGDSDKPHEPAAYAVENVAQDVVAVLDAVGINKAHFWGYSRGGRIGFQLGIVAPDRFESLILGGAHPYPTARSGITSASPEAIAALRRGGMAAYVEVMETRAGSLPTEVKTAWMGNDPLALLAIELAMASASMVEIEASAITLPALLYCGERDMFHDSVQAAARTMRHATFVSLPGLNHGQTFQRSGADLILPRVRTFLADIRVPASR